MLWTDENRVRSRRHDLKMNGSQGLLPIEDLPSEILERRVEELPRQTLENLGLHLFNDARGVSGNWEGVAEVLGISKISELEEIRRRASVKRVFPGYLMLSHWAERKGSTVYVLLNALRKQHREDCIDLVVKACRDARCMELLVKIEDHGRVDFKKVPTTVQATLRDSLENVLTDPSGGFSGLGKYIITGPFEHLNWFTPAGHLQGSMLSLKKNESADWEYEPVQIPPFKSMDHQGNMAAGYQRSNSNIGLNIPVDSPQSVSCNFTSTTVPKAVEAAADSMTGEYNNLGDIHSHREGNRFPTFSSSPCIHHDQSYDTSLKQTLLKTPASFDDLTTNTEYHPSSTLPKQLPSEVQNLRERAQRLAIRRPKQPSPHYENTTLKSPPTESVYIPHNHPMISFSNQSPRSSPLMTTRPVPCVQHPIYVPHGRVGQPVPCVFQRRRDGYIEIVGGNERDQAYLQNAGLFLRQQSEPERSNMTTSPDSAMSRSFTEGSKCILGRDVNGYATFALQDSAMDVDYSSGQISESSQSSDQLQTVTFNLEDTPAERVQIERDENGYMTYSANPGAWSASTNPGASFCQAPMKCESSSKDGRQPVLIQQGGDGYAGFFATSPPSDQSNCSGYISMSRPNAASSRNVSSGSDHVAYASMPVDDEEKDAECIADNESTDGYSDINPSEYDYINDSVQSELRCLPPRPSPPLPMKRRRLKPQDQLRGASTNTQLTTDLDSVPGWCPSETEESIWSTMKRHKAEDGNFIVWWMESKRRYVITVSHLNELRHYAVYERRNLPGHMFVFSGGHDFGNLRDLVEHYMREGLKGPDLPVGQSRGKRWQQFSHVKLRKPLKVKHTHTAVRVKPT